MGITSEGLDDIAKMITDGISYWFGTRPILNQNLFHTGKAKPVIDSVHKFDDVFSAYDTILTGHARGKVVVEVA